MRCSADMYDRRARAAHVNHGTGHIRCSTSLHPSEVFSSSPLPEIAGRACSPPSFLYARDARRPVHMLIEIDSLRPSESLYILLLFPFRAGQAAARTMSLNAK